MNELKLQMFPFKTTHHVWYPSSKWASSFKVHIWPPAFICMKVKTATPVTFCRVLGFYLAKNLHFVHKTLNFTHEYVHTHTQSFRYVLGFLWKICTSFGTVYIHISWTFSQWKYLHVFGSDGPLCYYLPASCCLGEDSSVINNILFTNLNIFPGYIYIGN